MNDSEKKEKLDGCTFFKLEHCSCIEMCIYKCKSWDKCMIIISTNSDEPIIFDIPDKMVDKNKSLFCALDIESVSEYDSEIKGKKTIIFKEKQEEQMSDKIINAVKSQINKQS